MLYEVITTGQAVNCRHDDFRQPFVGSPGFARRGVGVEVAGDEFAALQNEGAELDVPEGVAIPQ